MEDQKTLGEKSDPFASLDGRKGSAVGSERAVVESLADADEALAFLENHPRAAEIALEGAAILEDPVQYKKLLRKIDFTIAPLLAVVYFLQFLDKTTLSYTSVMGIVEDANLVGQQYSYLSMLFYIGTLQLLRCTKENKATTNTIQASSQRNFQRSTWPNASPD